jgi:hypothetical protein
VTLARLAHRARLDARENRKPPSAAGRRRLQRPGP